MVASDTRCGEKRIEHESRPAARALERIPTYVCIREMRRRFPALRPVRRMEASGLRSIAHKARIASMVSGTTIAWLSTW
jgi:hypothetical protein